MIYDNFPVLDFQLNRITTLGANGFDDRVGVERGGDSEHVPGAVGEVGLAVRVDLEICRNP